VTAFLLAGEMAVAYFMAHAPHSFWPAENHGEGAILFCFVFLYLIFAGPGAWSIDGWRWGASSRRDHGVLNHPHPHSA
jgi:putative oxidoreductase